jgi:hypothetical protein
MAKKYLDTKQSTIEASVLDVWAKSSEEQEAIRNAAEMMVQEKMTDRQRMAREAGRRKQGPGAGKTAGLPPKGHHTELRPGPDPADPWTGTKTGKGPAVTPSAAKAGMKKRSFGGRNTPDRPFGPGSKPPVQAVDPNPLHTAKRGQPTKLSRQQPIATPKRGKISRAWQAIKGFLSKEEFINSLSTEEYEIFLDEMMVQEDDEHVVKQALMKRDGLDHSKVSDGGVHADYRAKARKLLDKHGKDAMYHAPPARRLPSRSKIGKVLGALGRLSNEEYEFVLDEMMVQEETSNQDMEKGRFAKLQRIKKDAEKHAKIAMGDRYKSAVQSGDTPGKMAMRGVTPGSPTLTGTGIPDLRRKNLARRDMAGDPHTTAAEKKWGKKQAKTNKAFFKSRGSKFGLAKRAWDKLFNGDFIGMTAYMNTLNEDQSSDQIEVIIGDINETALTLINPDNLDQTMSINLENLQIDVNEDGELEIYEAELPWKKIRPWNTDKTGKPIPVK